MLAVAAAIIKAVEERGPSAKPLPGGPLRELASRDGIAIGTAVDATALRNEPGYRDVLGREFSSVTPENAMKWDAVEPSRGDFHWQDADALVGFARSHDQKIRGHTLVWHEQTPDWVRALPPSELRKELKAHIFTEVGRYKGQVGAWDVVNEVLADSGTLRNDFWLRKLGPGYIVDAFRWAHEADPDATLYINEIGADDENVKSDGLYKLVRALKAQGVPVDGVGFQAHLSLDGVPPGMQDNLRRFAALGLKVAITEADVRVRQPANDMRLDVQGGVYGDLVRLCRNVQGCASLTFWGFTDRHSWIPTSSPGYGSATLLDDQLEPKPAYRAVVQALR